MKNASAAHRRAILFEFAVLSATVSVPRPLAPGPKTNVEPTQISRVPQARNGTYLQSGTSPAVQSIRIADGPQTGNRCGDCQFPQRGKIAT